MRIIAMAAASAALLTAGISAQSLTTPPNFVSNNGGGDGGGVYFDLTATSDLTIDSLDLNFSAAAGTPVTINVYARVGTHVGFEATTDGWLLVTGDTGGVVTAGLDLPTSFTLATPVCLSGGATFGIAIETIGSGHRYTNGDGTNQTVSNADLAFSGGSANNTVFGAAPFTPRVANATFNYTVGACTGLTFPPTMVGVAEATAGTGTLGTGSGSFTDGWDLRWNLADPTGSYPGAFGAVAVNIGIAGPPPVAMTAAIPGLMQTWSGSTPSGPVEIFPPAFVGAPDFSVTVPAGLFNPGDTVRIQGVVLDASVASATRLPVVVTPNTILFTYTDCQQVEDFEGVASGVGNYPVGWANGGGIAEWQVDSNGTPSGSTGPSSAVSGANYMYCETSSPRATGDTFIMDTASYPTAAFVAGGIGFQLSRVGATIDTLNVEASTDGGATYTSVAMYVGPEPSGLEWTNELIDVSSVIAGATNVQFRFTYTRGTSFTGDIAIDDFCIR